MSGDADKQVREYLTSVARQVAAVQESVARQARDVAGLAEAVEEHQTFLRAWRDFMRELVAPEATRALEGDAAMDIADNAGQE